jgi:hypothetical protein
MRKKLNKRQNIKKRSLLPIYAVLIGCVAPMILYANNLGEVTLVSLWRPILFSCLLNLLIFGLAYLIFKSIHRAGLVTGLLAVFIYSYGHLYNLVKPLSLLGHQIGRHRFLFPVLLLIFGFVIWRVIVSKSDFGNMTKILNTVILVLFAFQLFRISSYEIQLYRNRQETAAATDESPEIVFDGERRDIYILLLDEYRRSDWLNDSIGYDNSAFIQNLEDLGFYVPSCSMSNYSYTQLSMTSELNMVYVDELFDPLSDIYTSDLLKHSEVRRTVEALGYETVFFQNFYPWVDINDGDHYFKPEDVSTFDPFELLYLKTTILVMPYDLLEQQIAELRWSQEHEDTTRFATLIQSIFDYLQQPHDYTAPVFVYAHILSPHSPDVFNADGTINYDWTLNQSESLLSTYQYLDNEVIVTIEAILENSEIEPIIIIQSDHGAGEGAYKNLTLNAFYFPDGGDEYLYPTITPVNFFRIVFDYYYEMDFDLLEDKSYYSERLNRYQLEEIQDPYDYCQNLQD